MKKENTSFLKGMVKQASGKQQPEGSWNFALNALFGSWDGDSASITNEVGNEVCFGVVDEYTDPLNPPIIEQNYTLIGASILVDNKFVLFFSRFLITDSEPITIIGIHDPINCNFEILVKTNCLGLYPHRQLNIRTRIIKGCERVVYFTDKITSYKAINLDFLEQYLALDSGTGLPTHNLDNTDPLYANLAVNYSSAWNCVKFNHFLSFDPGCIELIDVRDSGGNIKAGSHQFTMRYLDDDLNPTNWKPLTHPIFVYLEGVRNKNADGETPGTVTSKSIKFKLIDLDPTFTFVQLGVASAIDGTGDIDEAFILDKLQIFTVGGITEVFYTYYGFDSTTHVISSLAQLTVPTIPLQGVVSHEITDNRLLLGNTTNPVEDWGLLQRASLLAKTKWRMYKDYDLDPNKTGPREENAAKNSVILFDRKTLMRDEVYSLGVVFLLEDGSETPAMHIPGRPINEDFDGNSITNYLAGNARNNHNTRGNDFSSLTGFIATNDWDDRLLEVTFDAKMTDLPPLATGVGDENTKVAHSNVTYLLDTLACAASPVNSPPTSALTYDHNSTTGLFTLNGLGPTDRAIVRLTKLGIGRTEDQTESIIGFLTAAVNTITTATGYGTDVPAYYPVIMSYQIFYYNGSTNKAYHEITAGSTFRSSSSGTLIYLNECSYDFEDLCNVKRWKVHNTFVVTGTGTETGEDSDPIEGYMGYHENENSFYPEVKDCDGNKIFDALAVLGSGSNLAGEPIRHHRLPDCGGDSNNFDFNTNEMGLTKRDWVDSADISFGGASSLKRKIALNKMGLIVDMTDVYANIPTLLRNKIKGHYIVYGKRTQQNKTIIDKGYLWRNHFRASFYRDILDLPIPFYAAVPFYLSTYYTSWFFHRKLTKFTLGIPVADDLWAFDDDIGISLSPAGFPFFNGRIDRSSSDMVDGYRASISYTTGLVSYLGYGYNGDLDYDDPMIIGELSGSYYHGTQNNFSEYVSPTTVFDQSIPTGDYVKIECPIASYHPTTSIPGEEYELSSVQVFGMNWGCFPLNAPGCLVRKANWGTLLHADFNHIATFVGNGTTGNTNISPLHMSYLGFHRKIIGSAIIPANSVGTASQFTNPVTLHTDAFGQVSTFYQTELPFPQVLTPSATKLSDCLRGIDEAVGPAQQFLEDKEMNNYYVAIKNYKEVFRSLEAIIYQRLNICYIPQGATYTDELITGGDTFITKVRDVKTWSKYTGTEDDQTGLQGPFEKMKSYAVSMEGYCESDTINSALGHTSIPESNYALKSFARFTYLSIQTSSGFNRVTLWGDPDMDDYDEVKDLNYGYRQFKFQYNKDFGKNHVENPGFPLSDTYNYCNQCAGKEPNSIYYSNKGFSQDSVDSFKLILANNKFTIPSESGEITNLFLEQDKLYAHTSKVLFSVQTKPQKLNSNEATIFVGTGEIGSIPPKKLISVMYGYAGSEDAYATVSTQFGTFFIDESSGRLFLLSKGINEISKKGMEQWFHDNLPLNFKKQFYQLTSSITDPLTVSPGEAIEYPVKDTSSENAIGFQAIYDPRLNRVILHKKDYLIRDTNDLGNPITFAGLYSVSAFPGAGVADTLYAKRITEGNYVRWYYWDIILVIFVEITLNDVAWFINKSWTMSYALDGNFWVSFHSYQPNLMYNDDKNMYSFINRIDNGTVIWKHVERNYQTYYGTKYDHIIDITLSNKSQEKVSHSIQLISNIYLYNVNNSYSTKIENITFDKFYTYNSKQASTKRDLIVKTSNSYQDIQLPLSQTLIDRTENYWRFNRFRDEVTDRTIPFFTSEWTELQSSFDLEGQGYLDKTLDLVAIDGTKSIYQQARFRDKYFAVRLFFNDPSEDYKIKTEILTFLTNLSTR